jgi:ketosteroid isomerase-like protein
MRRHRVWFAVVLVLSAMGCTKKTPPEPGAELEPTAVVRKFVELSAGAKDLRDRQALQQMATGPVREAFEKMSEETFQMSYLGNRIRVKDLAIVESHQEGAAAIVRYKVTIENAGGSDTTTETNERQAQLRQLDGRWVIENLQVYGTDKIAFTNGMLF